MSGGVDSSLAAYLLKEAGYDVIGVTMRMWDPVRNSPSGVTANASGSRATSHEEDARRVAQQLGIPLFVLNLVEKFEQEIIGYFCREYLNARTPNPCVFCNKQVKFRALLGKARELAADFVSTGHYARVEYHRGSRRYLLKRGKDPKKDQSYFLFSLNQNQLARTLLPLGDFQKEDVRNKARKLGLRAHEKLESQEICFIPGMDYRPFLKRRLSRGTETGDIVNSKGHVLGRHKGVPYYTIGQRRGLGIAAEKPLYVVGFDKERNLVFVGEKQEVYSLALVADQLNWIAMDELRQPMRVTARIRSTHREADALVEPSGRGMVRVTFTQPQEAITPGQAVVFYEGEIVLGGGWIQKAIKG